MKKSVSILLCFLMIFNIFPIKTLAEEQSLEEIIRPQIEAFAKSIDKKNAAGEAQDALVLHGLGGKGKKLSVGENHVITAALMNSELAKQYLTVLCTEFVEIQSDLETDAVYSLGYIYYTFDALNQYRYRIYDYDAKGNFIDSTFKCPKDYIKISPHIDFKKSNSYDNKLEMAVGYSAMDVDLSVSKIYDNKIVYDVKVTFIDVFDFSAENGSAIENLLGLIGLITFKPFDWEAKADFQIEIPIEKPEENVVFGDSDGNGSVDVMDAYFARLVAAKIVKPTAEQLAFCDVDSDGKITAIDANLIRKYALGIIKELPVR